MIGFIKITKPHKDSAYVTVDSYISYGILGAPS